MYNVALFLHLLGVALLVGTVTITVLTALRVQTASTVRKLRSLVAGTKWGEAFIGPAMIIILASGIYLVAQHGNNPWSAGWVITALVLTVLVSVIGVTVERVDDKRIRTAIANATGETPHAELRAIQLAARPIYVLFFSSSLVVALLFLMTNRPGLFVSIAASVIAAVAGLIAAAIRVRSVRQSRNALRVDA